ncbi:MAG: hypothetical protein EBU90_20500, partial [Proteobacteria bacterium]|nr:hypothetical protein [Pseudomonadota bacterium]
MSEVCLSCVKQYSTRIGSAGSFKARAIIDHSPVMKIGGIGKVTANNSLKPSSRAKLSGESSIQSKVQLSIGLQALGDSGIGDIKAALQLSGNLRSRISATGFINDIKTDKFAGNITALNKIDDFQATQKLYPIRDVVTSLNNSYFVDSTSNTDNLFANIDEGVFIGNYTKNGKNSKIIADEQFTYIQPSSTMSDGDFRYTCEVTRPIDNAEESFIFIRAAAPTYTKSSDVPPLYRIHNIKLVDPSGNLIVKYKDVFVRGDADYQSDYVNFATYISEPETNKLLLHTWESGYPLMHDPACDIDGPNWPPKPAAAALNPADREKNFGKFTYVYSPTYVNPEGITITGPWISNITQVHIPQLSGIPGAPASCTVPFHASAASQLTNLFQDWHDAGLMYLVLSWGGSW